MKRWLWVAFLLTVCLNISVLAAVEREYFFNQPEMKPVHLNLNNGPAGGIFYQAVMPDSPLAGHVGQPLIPHRPVQLLIPQGETLESVEVECIGWDTLNGQYTLEPSQHVYRLSHPEDAILAEPDSQIYSQTDYYPEQLHSQPKIFWCKGYQIITFNLFPVRTIPAEGIVEAATSMQVRINTRPALRPTEVVRCRGLASDQAWVARKVDNPEMILSYHAELQPVSDHLNSRDEYQYVIVTNSSVAGMGGPNNFQDLLALKYSRGITGTIKTVEEISVEYPGVDTQTKIRNFCIDAYNNWNTEYILLGADHNTVPTRGCYATAEGNEDSTIPTDMYFGCLDGTWDASGNGIYGEINDGPGGGDPDVYAELFVGRASVETTTELHNFVSKTITYETDDYTQEYHDNVLLLGEYLWTATYGGDYMDELWYGSDLWGYSTPGYPADWEVDYLYERVSSWGASDLSAKLNANDVFWVNHLGHASTTSVMHFSTSNVTSLTNSHPFIVYSQGCYAGSFDSADCIAEAFSYADHAAFSVLMCGRYGFGEIGCTDGPSQYFQRQFHDALFGENIHEVGRMNQDSKEDNVWCLDYKANRWCCYEVNLLGCPETPLRGTLGTRGHVALDRPAYRDGGNVKITVTDVDLNLDPLVEDTTSIQVSVNNDADLETLVLEETGPNTSTFQACMEITSDAYVPANGHLEAAENDTLTVTYIDASDGFGHTNVPVTDTAVADYTFPSMSNVQVAFVDDHNAVITWETDELCTSSVIYGTAIPPVGSEAVVNELQDAHSVTISGLDQCLDYYFYAVSEDAAGNMVMDDNGGAYFNFTTMIRMSVLDEDMENDPGWTITGGDWQWGQPTGGPGGPGHDPTAGFDGPNVYGTNLTGAYQGGSAYHLITPALDCSASFGTRLSFYRWLAIDANDSDEAYVAVSTDGTTWTNIYENPASNFYEYRWTYVEYDISAIADGQPEVYIRWTMGPAGSGTVGGWNIDNVQVSYPAPCNVPILIHYSHVIDDAAGNGDGQINPLELIQMPVTLRNVGLDATNVTAQLTSVYPNVNITEDSASYGSIAQGGYGDSMSNYQFTLLDTAIDGDKIPFELTWNSTESSGSTRFVKDVVAPKVMFDSVMVLDNFGDGDGDGIWDPGETVQLAVTLKNSGRLAAMNVTGTLDSASPYITIDDAAADYPDIAAGGLGTCADPYFMGTSQLTTPDHTVVQITVEAFADGHHAVSTFELEITTSTFARRFFWDMNTDPGWTAEGQWEWGQPLGTGGDPSSGYTDENVYGYNLAGEYASGLPATNLTTNALNCSNFTNVEVRFMRWLGVESNSYDHATFQASPDGTSWTTIWDHDGASFTDPDWLPQVFDISAVADEQSTVFLRWVMGSTDSSVTYCGWNIDDVEIWAESNNPQAALMYDSHVVDDSAGNGDGQLNPSEAVSLDVTATNLGIAGAGITAYLSSSSTSVTITQDYSTFPDLAAYASGETQTPFELTVSEDAGDGEEIPFTVTWFSDAGNGSFQFIDEVVGPNVAVDSTTILDGAGGGDGDGVLDPGETIQLSVLLQNTGRGDAVNVSAELATSTAQYVIINDHFADFPDLTAGGTAGSIAPHFAIYADPTTPDHTMASFTLTVSADNYSVQIPFELEITTSNFIQRYMWNLDEDPGWTCENLWAWGVPQGNSGDPNSGYTGANVYGYNLDGAYSSNMNETNLTSTAIDCSNLMNVEVRFMRWLGIESSSYDHATFSVSNNGTTWSTIWSHSGDSFTDPDWQAMTYDISAVADEQPTVYLRWVMGDTDTSVTYCGWNIDDVEIWANSSGPIVTPTPVATATPEPTATPFICINDGDVDNNADLTPQDALLTFQIYLGSFPDPTEAEACAADCNGDDTITPQDALCIFLHYLSSSCDCVEPMVIGKSSPSSLHRNQSGHCVMDADLNGNEITVVLDITDHPNEINAFGLSLHYPAGLEFLGCTPLGSVQDWEVFGSHDENNIIRIGGFDPVSSIPADEAGTIAAITFRLQDRALDSSDFYIFDLKDDLAGLQVNTSGGTDLTSNSN